MSECGKQRVSYSKKGIATYEIEIWHDDLGKHKVIRSKNSNELQARASEMMAKWDVAWDQLCKSKEAEQRTRHAKQLMSELNSILNQTLTIDDSINWEATKDRDKFGEPKPVTLEYPKKGFLALFLASAKMKHEQKIAQIDDEYEEEMKGWEASKVKFLKDQDEFNSKIDEFKESYEAKEPESIIRYCELVLNNSSYPDFFPKTYELDFNPDNGVLILNYQLPALEDIPTITGVRYIKTRDEFVEKELAKNKLNSLYDEILYQIAIRTLHELYEADKIDVLSSITFNGYVETFDRKTGAGIAPCVLSVQSSKEEFNTLALSRVEPKACFKALKGIAASRLYSMTPIAPVLQMDRDDSRFVTPYGVADGLSDVDNIAAMDWQDFEHLIRELFEKEFGSAGAEVKVTQASRDKGVDAVAFDPDPIRGGKTVIQAKRYTLTVGVSAVRDLYGTVLNEGAGKGILVTTSDFGPDAYEFASNKPLVLINGNNLLHMLEKHGHKAKIDIKEARRILAEREE